MVAYDLETTRIAKGTPRPLYLTLYGEDDAIASPLRDLAHLGELVVSRMLTDARRGFSYVAWNANGFDAYFIAASLLSRPEYIIRPFLTRTKNLRGMLVIDRADVDKRDAAGWYFLDGMAMLGLAGTSLQKLLKTFAPDHHKLVGIIDFDKQDFDPLNPAHCAYALRDSEGLYHAMTRAQAIMIDHFSEPLAVTMGRAGIRIFQRNMPVGVSVHPMRPGDLSVIRDYAMRGGYCHCARRYQGPVWKFDLNQAYAAAMREARLPAGYANRVAGLNRFARVFVCRIRATKSDNRIPFYHRTIENRRLRSVMGVTAISDTWITSIEYEQLRSEGWAIDVSESIFFDDSFSMTDYVDRLEHLRMTCDGGPSGAIGTMVKAVGNMSYGKTVEILDPLELILTKDPPNGFSEYFAADNDTDLLLHVWSREKEVSPRGYHQPQIGAFITAHVRMVVRKAALINPESWLYADTDCVVFDSDVSKSLNIHPSRYGAWKIEEAGAPYRIIAKKVYSSVETRFDEKMGRAVPTVAHAKGLNVKRLSADDFSAWYDGNAPVQEQIQRQSFVSVMSGRDMYRNLNRSGTRL